jgi:microcystin-dependent protein
MSSVLRRTGALSAVERHTVGDTKTSLVANDHVGWLLCDGRTLNVDDFRHLFSVIGYSFGGSGSTFNLPDPMGRVPGFLGQSSGGGNTWIMGDVSGSETHTLTIAEIPAHNHDISGGYLNVSGGINPLANGQTSADLTGITLDASGQHNHGGNTGNAGWAATSHTVTDIGGTQSADDSGTHNHTISPDGLHSHVVNDPKHRHQIASNGGSQPHNNMQPTIFLGNLFVYAGRLFKDATTTNTYPPYGPPRNIY